MCKKCEEMRTAFQATEDITDRQVLWTAFDAQRQECEKAAKKAEKKAK
ncbi:MAG: hypothetical protein UY48_C0011G0034 [Candidatus Gottesmanbacteria bacterium GW2011_GWB1_49_7]|uniref:Uncharacterized protein n=1 Tax=Candidatus Gottesmanbacteria bacterium GW2011_GWB1_49_7 TaxID=1618448 RepID=A0A0G1YC87_9BACT|nr:MAG: hypothetical protein UY48_C0011G0034 [Candidatus Gottesmanbacteria bacterium GW2011_GWB1_49_7]